MSLFTTNCVSCFHCTNEKAPILFFWFKSMATYLLLFLSWHCSYLPLTCHYLFFDIGRERAVQSLSKSQLFECWGEKKSIFFFLAASSAIMDDVLEKHKDKNYLVWRSTHDGEEWNDKANEGQRGHQVLEKKAGLGGGKKEKEKDRKSNQEVCDLEMSETSLSKNRLNGVRKGLCVNQGHCSVKFMMGCKTWQSPWKVQHGNRLDVCSLGRINHSREKTLYLIKRTNQSQIIFNKLQGQTTESLCWCTTADDTGWNGLICLDYSNTSFLTMPSEPVWMWTV